MSHQGKHFIRGEFKRGSGIPFTAHNPATGETVWEGHHMSPDEISCAMQAAHHAQEHWSTLSRTARFTYLKKFQQIVESHQDELARIISMNQGKPLWESHTEVRSVIAKIDIAQSAYEERCHIRQATHDHIQSIQNFKPHGVVLVLGAFNFPAHLANGHIIPALLAGNTVVYKPSEHTPLVAEYIMRYFAEADLPTGVLQCLQGDGNSAQPLLEANCQAVCFTGSATTGRKLHRHFAGKPEVLLALEMGGNNPLIVESSAELTQTVTWIAQSVLLTTGQRCTSARRLIIPDDPFGDNLLENLIEHFRTVKIGAYTENPEPYMGPVITPDTAKSHVMMQAHLIAEGGIPLLRMEPIHPDSAWLSPGIMDMQHVNKPPDIEIFAPLLQVFRYRTFTSALQIANNTQYGLAASLIGEDPEHYATFYRNIRAGLIHWNQPTTGASSQLSFGGVGISGNHRPSGYFAADYCAYPVASLTQESAYVLHE